MSLSRAAFALVLVLGGCDSLFNLDHVPAGGGHVDGDAMPGHDDGGLDAIFDASLCGAFDEDGDGLFDDCDPCPAVGGSTLDTDMDGLPDTCDPNLGPPDSLGHKKDKILFYAMFSKQSDLDDNFNAPAGGVVYLSTNSAISVSGDGMLNGAALLTKQSLSPTKIELDIGGLGGGGVYVNEVSIVEPAVTCHIFGTGCNQVDAGQTCFYISSTAKGMQPDPSSDLKKLELYKNGTSMATCRVTGSSSTATSGTGTLSQSTIQIAVSKDASMKILSMVVYGAGT